MFLPSPVITQTSKCGLSLDHPEDKGAGKRSDYVVFIDDHGVSAISALG